MQETSLNHYAKYGFEFKSIINRLFITQTAQDEFDLTLKPKIVLLDMFPSFCSIEMKVKDNRIVSSGGHYNIIWYSLFVVMSFVIFLISLTVDRFYSFAVIIWVLLVFVFKVYGYIQLKSIVKEIASTVGEANE